MLDPMTGTAQMPGLTGIPKAIPPAAGEASRAYELAQRLDDTLTELMEIRIRQASNLIKHMRKTLELVDIAVPSELPTAKKAIRQALELADDYLDPNGKGVKPK